MKIACHLSRQLALGQLMVYIRSIFVSSQLLGGSIGNEAKKVLAEEIEESIERKKASTE